MYDSQADVNVACAFTTTSAATLFILTSSSSSEMQSISARSSVLMSSRARPRGYSATRSGPGAAKIATNEPPVPDVVFDSSCHLGYNSWGRTGMSCKIEHFRYPELESACL
ncbi:uncharacterized protein PITG_09127 [Phytophthora infestans T30-4]|uniref:Uncharacterized protein n=1 Tax=Phytophthora infestans (strain T30-4) TaxID=403677 RepID=D0NBS0_PHYIT|nr:uncharacterized protein PITG_09127 [Phytophthora infestans T30-4]EEY55225.1 hypothetical protein PITG_09127 [Phytophthora infestans T30-4]|eukprot:XP_002903449.1 hypothetical protein PITG_09127 [Phytophthora infestans T30-4]